MQSGKNKNINKHIAPIKKLKKQPDTMPQANIAFTNEEIKAASKRAMAKYRDAYVELAKYDSN